jgi:hypothetical protein
MPGEPPVHVSKSGTFKEINITGQVANLSYNGMILTVFHDILDFSKSADGEDVDVSKIEIDRQIECTLYLRPAYLRAWAVLLHRELERYERLYGKIPSSEELDEEQCTDPTH